MTLPADVRDVLVHAAPPIGQLMKALAEAERALADSPEVTIGLSSNATIDLLGLYLRREAVLAGVRARIVMGKRVTSRKTRRSQSDRRPEGRRRRDRQIDTFRVHSGREHMGDDRRRGSFDLSRLPYVRKDSGSQQNDKQLTRAFHVIS